MGDYMKKHLWGIMMAVASSCSYATDYGTFNFTISSDPLSAVVVSFDYVVCGDPKADHQGKYKDGVDECSLQPDGGRTGLNERYYSHQILYPGQTLNLVLPKMGPSVNYVKTFNEMEGTGYTGRPFIFAPFCYAYAGGSLKMHFLENSGIVSHVCDGSPHKP